ncbi:hypothetical protein EI42_02894 [Thermosporothrix hazakensis]|jgi:alpha-beta hydrolase superfamily lysophospholipase|uniref:Uncharacterized protein n=2 Tax=Thermosporothrix TaxID=768650 RepID=A0A326UER5_THEHA|nr:hypothetical protein [Thermosporothrix hazakensis]PZW29173.1 hypothetical protein EI42_02894 [Thermosporothrix hazakensis]BBH86100.1 hypothetical protein KTC_08510 [Thermosporothrix sp. COM3]GCE45475.1 hypothetical protein KTH_03440 [Thermosporothrix hazakensis]
MLSHFLVLSGLWVAMGAVLGLLIAAATGRKSARLLLAGSGLALSAGWLGVWLLGTPFATPWSLWVTLLGLFLLARFVPAFRLNR